MIDNEKPAGADDADGLNQVSMQGSSDDFENRAIADRRKQDQLRLSETIGEIMVDLGPAESDTEEAREFREFLVRLLVEPLDAVNLLPPTDDSDNYRVIVAFQDEGFSDICIKNDLEKAGHLAARLCRLNDCEIGRFKSDVRGAA